MIYLDTTALVKLITTEPETAALTDYLHTHTDTIWYTSALTRIELLRTATALHPDATDHANHILSGLDTVTLSDHFITEAAHLTPPPPRLLDAIHIAAALTARPHRPTFITYDTERAHAAHTHNLTTHAPGGGRTCSDP